MKTLAILLISALSIATFTAKASTALESLIQDARQAYRWNCRGYACDGVAAEQIRALGAVANYVDYLPLPLPVSTQESAEAFILASVICGSSMRIEYPTLIRLVSAENRALARLAKVQKATGYRLFKTCTRTIQ